MFSIILLIQKRKRGGIFYNRLKSEILKKVKLILNYIQHAKKRKKQKSGVSEEER